MVFNSRAQAPVCPIGRHCTISVICPIGRHCTISVIFVWQVCLLPLSYRTMLHTVHTTFPGSRSGWLTWNGWQTRLSVSSSTASLPRFAPGGTAPSSVGAWRNGWGRTSGPKLTSKSTFQIPFSDSEFWVLRLPFVFTVEPVYSGHSLRQPPLY